MAAAVAHIQAKLITSVVCTDELSSFVWFFFLIDKWKTTTDIATLTETRRQWMLSANHVHELQENIRNGWIADGQMAASELNEAKLMADGNHFENSTLIFSRFVSAQFFFSLLNSKWECCDELKRQHFVAVVVFFFFFVLLFSHRNRVFFFSWVSSLLLDDSI